MAIFLKSLSTPGLMKNRDKLFPKPPEKVRGLYSLSQLYDSGYLGPGGLHKGGLFWNCIGGAAGYINQKLNKYYPHGVILRSSIYNSPGFNVLGVLGTLMCIVQVFIGAQVGTSLLTYKTHRARLIQWSVWAVLTGLTGGILCNFSKEEGIIPVNKKLISLSFMLVTTSFSFILFAVCYILIDVKQIWSGKPFLYLGMNTITIYIMDIHGYVIPFQWNNGELNTHFLHLIRAVWRTALLNFIAYRLYENHLLLSI